MFEIRDHVNALDVELKGKRTTQRCCWKLPLLDGWEGNGFFEFFVCLILVEGKW